MTLRTWRLTAGVMAAAILAGACGGSSATPAPATPAPATEAPATPAPATEPPATASAPVEIKWFVGLGTGDNMDVQVPVEQQVVDDWNAAHPEIHVTLEVVPNTSAKDTLLTENASGNPPDVVGPAGVSGSNGFYGQWLDLAPLIKDANYDLSQFPQAAVDFFQVGGQGQLGLPFASYPSFMFYRPSLFEEAGLNPPPTAYGEKYTMPDGSQVDWSWDTITALGQLLTVDANGKDATSPDFNAKKVVQYGYHQPWNGAPEWGTWFKAGSFYNGETKEIAVPDGWAEAWQWQHDSVFKYHFQPSFDTTAATEWGEQNAFPTGKIAMAMSYTWYTCCLGDVIGTDWNIAPAPSYQGQASPDLNADTFRISAGSKHPAEAFQFLTYLVGEAAPKLLVIYGGMPARPDQQDAFFAELDKQFTQGVNWDIAKKSLELAAHPSAESYFPNYLKYRSYVYEDFSVKLMKDPTLDVSSYITSTMLPTLQSLAATAP